MADFARWATACEPGLGLKEGEFLRAYNANRREATETSLEASILNAPLRAFVDSLDEQGKDWTGTPTRLLELLTLQVGERAKSKDWPRKPNALTGKLQRLAPSLRKIGIRIEFGRGHGGRTITVFRKVRKKIDAIDAETKESSEAGEKDRRGNRGDRRGPTRDRRENVREFPENSQKRVGRVGRVDVFPQLSVEDDCPETGWKG
jgi:hypothetical protein